MNLNSDLEQDSGQGMFTPNGHYSTVIKHKLLPIVSDLPRIINSDMNYYGVANDDSDDSQIAKNVPLRTHKNNNNNKHDKSKRVNSYLIANSSKNKSNFESFRMESFNKETTKKLIGQNNDETNENFYLDIYNSFANLNSPLNDMLYVEDDPLNEFDQIEKNLSKSVCELSMLHKNVDNKETGDDELYYQDVRNNDAEKEVEEPDIQKDGLNCKVY